MNRQEDGWMMEVGHDHTQPQHVQTMPHLLATWLLLAVTPATGSRSFILSIYALLCLLVDFLFSFSSSSLRLLLPFNHLRFASLSYFLFWFGVLFLDTHKIRTSHTWLVCNVTVPVVGINGSWQYVYLLFSASATQLTPIDQLEPAAVQNQSASVQLYNCSRGKEPS